ncbi:ABC transporter permease subunit [Helcococcus kunzii]|uniref:ABC transporter permease n=1 Tax=Helcococcus kunzii TaxID=40091 RepID=UPI001C9718F2|nr:ABC transporter permease [Helcococcus kunzii]QZO75842.1 ABC transporter permease subunit [Helcococcus kunzii]
MLKFELKKIYKQKNILILLIFSLIISFYSVYITDKLGNTRNKYLQIPLNSTNLVSNKMARISENIYLSPNDYEDTFKKNFNKDINEIDRFSSLYLTSKQKKDPMFLKDNRYNRISISEEMRKKYDIKLNEDEQKIWEWVVFDNEYSKNNNVFSTSLKDSNFSDNFARKFIHTSDLTLGYPFIFLFILLFSNIISKENEENTNLFLYTQPISYRKIVFSKFMALIVSAILYLIFVFISTFVVFCILYKIPFNGFNEIYRVITDSSLKYLNSMQLISLIVFSYFSMVIFISGIIIFVSSRTKDTIKTLGIILLVFVTLFFLSSDIKILQNSFNPLYAMDYIINILGNMQEKLQKFELTYFSILPSGITPYIVFMIFGLLMLGGSFIKHEVKTRKFNSILFKNKINSIRQFEKIKLTKKRGFVFCLLRTFIVAACIFATTVYNNKIAKDDLIHKKLITQTEKVIKENEEKIKKLNTKDNDHIYMSFNEEFQNDLQNLKNIHDGYVNNNSKQFYSSLNDYNKKFYNIIDSKKFYQTYSFYFLKNKTLSRASYYENMALDKYSEKYNKPLIRDFHISKFDEFVNAEQERDIRSSHYVKSNSGIQIIQNFIDLKYINIILLLLASSLVFIGYSVDKNDGNQIEFMFTQPVKRKKYTLSKLIANTSIFITIILSITIFLFILGLIFEGLGELDYPVIYYKNLIDPSSARENSNYFTIIPVWKYIITNFGFLTIQAIFISCLTIFISIFVNKRIKLLTYTISIIVIGIFVANLIPNELVKIILPFTHFNAKEITDGSIRITQALTNYKTIYSVISLMSWSVLLFVLSNIFIKKNR